jgi:hypothetical protein
MSAFQSQSGGKETCRREAQRHAGPAEALLRPRTVVRHPTIRPSTIRPSRTSLDRRSEIATDRFQILYQKNYALCGNCLNLEFGLIEPFALIAHLF